MKNVITMSVKIILITILFIMLFCTFYNNIVYADPPTQAQHFNPDLYKPNTTTSSNDESVLKNIGNHIIAPMRVMGSFVSVFALVLIGIKYMLGSVEEKAEYKKTLVPYIIGCIMVFGIINILGIIYDISIQI